MKSRAQIKTEAMAGFKQIYWPAVGIIFLGFLITMAIGMIPGAGVILALLIGPLITVGLANVSLQIYRQWRTGVGELFTPFQRYGRVLGGMLWMWLWMFFWSLIFLVPYIIVIVATTINSVSGMLPNMSDMLYGGAISASYYSVASGLAVLMVVLLIGLAVIMIIKGLQYFCTQYILADSPNVPATKALELSKKMMDGHKAEVFVAVLSFIGWFLLSALTFYILWIFYVGPYYSATMAGFYNNIKWDAFNRGILTPEDFGESPQLYAQQEQTQQQYRDWQTQQQYQQQYGAPPQQSQYGQQNQYGAPQQPDAGAQQKDNGDGRHGPDGPKTYL